MGIASGIVFLVRALLSNRATNAVENARIARRTALAR